MISKESLKFLEDLKANNNRDWFQDNKKRYEAYKSDYHQLIRDFLEIMKPQDANLELLEVKNCTFRVNRDIRFSKDKSPYKTHLSVWLSTNPGGGNTPGYYIHLEKGKSFIAAGLYSPEDSELKKIRKEIAFFYDDLEEIIANPKFQKEFKGLERTETNALKNAPRDYEKDHPAIEFLKLKSFVAIQPLKDAALLKPNFVADISEKLLILKPLTAFLNRALEAD